MKRAHHPTRERLIEVTVELLETKGPGEISVDEVLNISGISKGSLYHHFADLADLVDAALAFRFAHFVDLTIAEIAPIVAQSQSQAEMFAGLSRITENTQSPAFRANRLERAQTVGRAARNTNLRELLNKEQARLNGALADLIREGQAKGWVAAEVDAMATAVLIQAYTLGRVLDDISDPNIDPAAWTSLIHRLVEKTLKAERVN
jgi:AcrR family transcriptional regulator